MAQRTRRKARVVGIALMMVAISIFVFGPLTRTSAQESNANSPAMKLAQLKLKFDGAKSCGGKNCHDKPGADAPPTELGHEYTIWNDADAHRKSFDRLSEKASIDMGAKLNIADVKSSARCVNCHALSVPAELQGQKFNIREGNSCGSCHGPSEKWLEPHAEKDWTSKQRAAGSHQKLLAEWGLYDTKPLIQRAEICVSCHLAIDADLVAAGHPQPAFELDYFTLAQPKHWNDPEGHFAAKIWLSGQVVAVEEAMKQLAARAAKGNAAATKDAYQQAMAHLGVFKAAAGAAGVDASGLSLKLESAAADAANIAKNVETMKTKVGSWDPNASKGATVKMLSAVAALNLVGEAGKFGMDQQAWAISSLYNAYASGEKVPDATKDEMNKLIEGKLFPPETGELTPEQFAKNLPEVASKLPR